MELLFSIVLGELIVVLALCALALGKYIEKR